MLTLPIKKRWFDMILLGEKKEEYRSCNDYYTVRFMNLFGVDWCNRNLFRCLKPLPGDEKLVRQICFRNGYCATSPSFIADCSLSIGKGKTEWGAEADKEYYILHIIKIIKVNSERNVENE